MAKIVVLGAGISGLVTAYRLQQRLPDAEVLLLERANRIGGTINTIQRDGFTVEAGPNGFPDNNPSTLQLAHELELDSQLLAASEVAGRHRFLFLNNRLRLLPGGLLALLGTDLLSVAAKVRIFTERFRPRRTGFAEESIDSFVRRRLGPEIARVFADAFVTGILAGDPKLLSMQACFPRIAAWERDHGSILAGAFAARRQRGDGSSPAVTRRAAMWSFAGGLQTLIDTLSIRLRQPPVLGVAVRRLLRDSTGWLVQAEGQDRWQADAVVLTCPAYAQAELTADLDAPLAELLAGIPYNRIAVVALGYRRADVPHPLDGFGYLSPQSARRDVLGMQWCSSIFPGRAPQGMVLLRALCGGWHRQDVVDWPDERLLQAVCLEMSLTLGVRARPIFHQIIRWSRAIPQYHVGHLERLARIEQRRRTHSGLFLGGNAYRGVAINDCVEQAGVLAAQIAAYLQT